MIQNPVIKIDDLSSGYQDKLVLKNISLEVQSGEIMTVLGTSGCGKTTLLKHLIGLMQPQHGTIEILGKDIAALTEKETTKLRRKMGVLFQNGALLNSIPVTENVAIPLEQHTNFSEELIQYLVQMKLQLVGLDFAVNYLPSELSGGMRKRAALARAIALDPVILFADEPGAGLDPVTLASLDNLLLSLKQKLGMTLVVVTHETGSIRRIADRVTYLHEGSILFTGTLQEALGSDLPELKSFFYSVP